MHRGLTPEGENAVSELAGKHGISTGAVRAMLVAVDAGRGSMAQFDIEELGGGGQWMRGGMTMVGRMFDHELKARVDGLCRDLSDLLANGQVYSKVHAGSSAGGAWWPSHLGSPSSTGGQNGSQYAYFPSARRLAVLADGRLSVYDTLDHSIHGVQQQQGSGRGSLEFTSQFGTFTAASLPLVNPDGQDEPSGSGPQSATDQPAPMNRERSSANLSEITAAIEALASLHDKGILTDAEFESKKAQLLERI